jgi:hypothetical protein
MHRKLTLLWQFDMQAPDVLNSQTFIGSMMVT